MVSKRREEESRMLLESEKALSNMMDDDRTDRVCPKCAIATVLKKCPKCGTETFSME
jgi:ribosomal protein S27AE